MKSADERAAEAIGRMKLGPLEGGAWHADVQSCIADAIRAAEADALERAAKVAETHRGNAWDHWSGAAAIFAAAIRALGAEVK